MLVVSRTARTLALALCAAFLALALSACGDDAKVGSKGAPAAAPGGTGIAIPPPAGTPEARTPDAATAKPGDWVSWEVRTAGSEMVTKLTWRALSVDGARVRFSIASETQDATGKTVAHVETEESRPATDGPFPAGTPDTVQVGGRDLAAVKTESQDVTAWHSREVPLGGLVRTKGPGGLEQVLVGYGRGR